MADNNNSGMWGFAGAVVGAVFNGFVNLFNAEEGRESAKENAALARRESQETQMRLEDRRQEMQLAQMKFQYVSQRQRQEHEAEQGEISREFQAEQNQITRDFQAQESKLSREYQMRLTEYVQQCEMKRFQTRLEYEKFLTEERRRMEIEMQERSQEFSVFMAFLQGKLNREAESVRWVMNNHPWRLHPETILGYYEKFQVGGRRVPPAIVISPPDVDFERYPNAPTSGLPKMSKSIEEGLRTFLSKHYDDSDTARPTMFYGGIWDTKEMVAETAATHLHSLLGSIPVIILESEVEGDLLNFRFFSWGMNQENYSSQPILSQFSHKEFVFDVQRNDALAWKAQREALLSNGLEPHEIAEIGGDREFNLKQLEKEEKYKAAGATVSIPYKPTKEGVQTLIKILKVMHCLIAGLVVDAYYFTHYNVPFKMPEVLSELVADLPSNEAQPLIDLTVSYYKALQQQLVKQNPSALPELLADLGFKLASLTDAAQDFARGSMHDWLLLRGVSLNGETDLFPIVAEHLTILDMDYVESLNRSLAATGIDRPLNIEQICLDRANRHFGRGEFRSTILDCEQVLYLNPDVVDGYYTRGLAYSKMEGQEAKAIEDFTKVIALESDRAMTYKLRADVYYKLGEYEKALSDYDQSIALGLSSAIEKRSLVQGVWDEVQRRNKAENKQQEERQRLVEEAQAFKDSGDIYYSQGDYEQALENYNRAISLGLTTIIEKRDRVQGEKEELHRQKEQKQRQLEKAKAFDLLPIEDLGKGILLELVAVPSGSYNMGSGSYDNRGEWQQVNLSAYYIGKHQITQAQYEAIMGNNPSTFSGANLPVESVSWNDAVAFCQKLSKKTGMQYRLPSEAEWEFACQAGSTTDYCFGNDYNQLANYAWFSPNSRDITHIVGQKKPNAWGLFDMYGNVWEWCQDHYSSASRVTRGGSFLSIAWSCRSAYRGNNQPDDRHKDLGFRVVCVRV